MTYSSAGQVFCFCFICLYNLGVGTLRSLYCKNFSVFSALALEMLKKFYILYYATPPQSWESFWGHWMICKTISHGNNMKIQIDLCITSCSFDEGHLFSSLSCMLPLVCIYGFQNRAPLETFFFNCAISLHSVFFLCTLGYLRWDCQVKLPKYRPSYSCHVVA